MGWRVSLQTDEPASYVVAIFKHLNLVYVLSPRVTEVRCKVSGSVSQYNQEQSAPVQCPGGS